MKNKSFKPERHVGHNVPQYLLVFKLGEMSKQPAETVLTKYETSRDQGWGALAKSLGIKPGSPEFHALKRGHDLYSHGSGGKGMRKKWK